MSEFKIGSVSSIVYECEVVNADGSIAQKFPPKNNLILDCGLDALCASSSAAGVIEYIAVGTGTKPTKKDSGTITFTRAGTTVTASGSFFASTDVGALLKFDSGEEMKVTAFTDTQNVTVGTSGTLASAQGTLYYVNQTTLEAEVARFSTLDTTVVNGGGTSLPSAGKVTIFATKLGPTVAGTVTYREIGWSWLATTGANLFGRDVLLTPIVLVAGQALRVKVSHTQDYSSMLALQDVADVGNNGYNTAGKFCFQDLSYLVEISSYRDIGGSMGATPGYALEPVVGGKCNLVTVDFVQTPGALTPQSVPTSISKDWTLDAYTVGSFYRTKSVTFGTTEAVGTHYGIIPARYKVAVSLKFTTPQTKDNAHTLTVVWKYTVGRVLVNT